MVEDFGLVVRPFGGGAFGGGDLADFGIPASIDGFDTPGGASFAGSNGLIGYLDKNGVGMSAREDASGHPAGLFDVYIEV